MSKTWFLPARISQSKVEADTQNVISALFLQQRCRKAPGILETVVHVNIIWLHAMASFPRNFPELCFSWGKCVGKRMKTLYPSLCLLAKTGLCQTLLIQSNYSILPSFIHLVRFYWVLPSPRSMIVAFCIKTATHNLASSSKLLCCNRMRWTQGSF